jgi:hypothetical protein
MSERLVLAVAVIAMVLGGCVTGPPRVALEGRPIWATKRQIRGGLEFDGVDDMVVTGFSPSMDRDSAFTITVWINTEKSPGAIFARAPLNQPNWAGGTKLLHVDTDGLVSYSVNRLVVVRGSTKVADGEWHHVAVAKDGNIHTLYLDGDGEGSGEVNMSYHRALDDPDHVVVLGFLKEKPGSDYPGAFGGRMDDVRFYNRALTPEEIRAMSR